MGFVPSEQEQRTARALLGDRHPLARALARQRGVARQTLVAAAPLPGAVVATALGVRVAPLFLGVSVLVAFVYLCASLVNQRTLRDRAQDLIAGGEGSDAVEAVARERRRLVSRRERERLARSLEQALDDSWNWERTPPSSRPLHGIQFLRDSAAEVRAIARRLRAERVRAQGVVLISRLLGDGQRSPLYAGDARRLHEELCRIRYLLEPTPRPSIAAAA